MAVGASEAIALGRSTHPDVALVDVHLIDGPTGIDVARALSADPRITVVFMTANEKRIPDDFAGALGVIAKPYSERAVAGVLTYVAACREGTTPSTQGLDGFRPAEATDRLGFPDDRSRRAVPRTRQIPAYQGNRVRRPCCRGPGQGRRRAHRFDAVRYFRLL